MDADSAASDSPTTGTGATTNGYFTTYGYDRAGNLTNLANPSDTPAITNRFDARNRITQGPAGWVRRCTPTPCLATASTP